MSFYRTNLYIDSDILLLLDAHIQIYKRMWPIIKIILMIIVISAYTNYYQKYLVWRITNRLINNCSICKHILLCYYFIFHIFKENSFYLSYIQGKGNILKYIHQERMTSGTQMGCPGMNTSDRTIFWCYQSNWKNLLRSLILNTKVTTFNNCTVLWLILLIYSNESLFTISGY